MRKMILLATILSFLLIVNLARADITSGLVSRWKFENNVLDSVGSNDGTRYNFTDGYVSGKFGYGLMFNTSEEQFVSLGDVLNFGTGNFSVSLWMKTDTTVDVSTIEWFVAKDDYDSVIGGWEIYQYDDNNVAFNVYNDSFNHVEVRSSTLVNDSLWHHVVGVRKDGNLTIYIDGNEERFYFYCMGDCSELNVNNTSPLLFGSDGWYDTTAFFNGTLDDIRIYNRALSDEDVQELYNYPNISNCTNITESGTYYLMNDTNVSCSYNFQCINISTSDVYLDLRGHTINGVAQASECMGINTYNPDIDITNVTILNGTLLNFYNGLHMSKVYDSNFAYITSNNSEIGIGGGTSSRNNFTNITVKGNQYYGLFLNDDFDGNSFTNLSLSGTVYYYDVYFTGYNSNNTFTDSVLGYVDCESCYDNPNIFYNNRISNFYKYGLYNVNQTWNTTRQDGIRIYGDGTEMGGNWWDSYSPSCDDTNSDGFCDDPYDTGLGYDYLPLSGNYSAPTTTTTTSTTTTTTTTIPTPPPPITVTMIPLVLSSMAILFLAIQMWNIVAEAKSGTDFVERAVAMFIVFIFLLYVISYIIGII